MLRSLLLIPLLLPLLGWSSPQVVALSGSELEHYDGIVVDIRTEQEWQETGVVAGAHAITFHSAEQFLNDIAPLLETGKPVALICRSGNRSNRAAQAIHRHLEQPVIDVAGGMLRLLDQGYQAQPPRCIGLC